MAVNVVIVLEDEEYKKLAEKGKEEHRTARSQATKILKDYIKK